MNKDTIVWGLGYWVNYGKSCVYGMQFHLLLKIKRYTFVSYNDDSDKQLQQMIIKKWQGISIFSGRTQKINKL